MDLFGLRWVGPNRQYRLRRHLAEDDLGSLWLGESTSTGAPSTIRILGSQFAADPFLVRRIGREIAPVFDLLIHPNVALVTNYSLLEDERHVFVVMEALEGQTLRTRLDEQDPIPAPDALRLAAEVASGLEAAHRLGIVHGAVGPDSVFLTPSRAKMIDFGLGIARHWRDGVASPSVSTDRPGRPERHRPLDASSDVEAVAALLSTLVAGRAEQEPSGPEPPPDADRCDRGGDGDPPADRSATCSGSPAIARAGATSRWRCWPVPCGYRLSARRRSCSTSPGGPEGRRASRLRPGDMFGPCPWADTAARPRPATRRLPVAPASTRPPQPIGRGRLEPDASSDRSTTSTQDQMAVGPAGHTPVGGLENALRAEAASHEPPTAPPLARRCGHRCGGPVADGDASSWPAGCSAVGEDVGSSPVAAGPTVATSRPRPPPEAERRARSARPRSSCRRWPGCGHSTP